MPLETKDLIKKLHQSVDELILQPTTVSQALWQEFLSLHAADKAYFFSLIERDQLKDIFSKLSQEQQAEVFPELSDSVKVFVLSFLPDENKSVILSKTPMDELTDLFDSLSDQDLKKYLTLLSTKDRKTVLSLMKFDPESAGGIMNTDVLTLMQNFTVEKSIKLLQRLQPKKEFHQQIYVTDQDNSLVGHIKLEDLVLKSPQSILSSFLQKNDLVFAATEDREDVAKKMVHYNVMTAPIIGENNYFLGVISTDTLVDVIEQEASEDVYRISAMTPIKYPYFETSFFRILYERSYILIILLLAQTISSMIIKKYEVMLKEFLMYFITMLTSAGGNASSQTSAVVIQGMASGDITTENMFRFLKRESGMAFLMALILGAFSFIRVYLTYGRLMGSLIVSSSLAMIVFVSVVLGSLIPLLLKKMNIDPAYAAGPFLATIMDILGLMIYCYVSSLFLPN